LAAIPKKGFSKAPPTQCSWSFFTSMYYTVTRNIDRFPSDFMCELTKEEFTNWRSQFVTSNRDKMGLRYSPMAFAEHWERRFHHVQNNC
jgi:hypothetical protein